jgi:hypothetical protein
MLLRVKHPENEDVKSVQPVKSGKFASTTLINPIHPVNALEKLVQVIVIFPILYNARHSANIDPQEPEKLGAYISPILAKLLQPENASLNSYPFSSPVSSISFILIMLAAFLNVSPNARSEELLILFIHVKLVSANGSILNFQLANTPL